MTTAKTRAEMQLAANERQSKRDAAHERQAKRAQAEHEIALQERAEQIAKLRALRLAKEASVRKCVGPISGMEGQDDEEARH